MFWKKKSESAKPKESAAQSKEPEAKKLPLKDDIIEHIEQLGVGQTLHYKVPESWGGDLIYIELNPQYPETGKKYSLGTETIADGKPSGKKSFISYSEKAKELAAWVLGRKGEPFITSE